MYSRKTGILYNESETQRKIDNFNNNLREQYRQKNTPIKASVNATKAEPVTSAKSDSSITGKLSSLLVNDDVIIIGLILLLLAEENTDYLLIGVLAALLFLSR